MRLNLRDLFWLTLLVAILVAWWQSNQKQLKAFSTQVEITGEAEAELTYLKRRISKQMGQKWFDRDDPKIPRPPKRKMP